MNNKFKNNFKDNIKNDINKKDEVLVSDTNINNDNAAAGETVQETKTFKIGKKQEDKNEKVSFPLYMLRNKIKELDRISKKTGYSRNELINMMIDFCLENIEFTD